MISPLDDSPRLVCRSRKKHIIIDIAIIISITTTIIIIITIIIIMITTTITTITRYSRAAPGRHGSGAARYL